MAVESEILEHRTQEGVLQRRHDNSTNADLRQGECGPDQDSGSGWILNCHRDFRPLPSTVPSLPQSGLLTCTSS